MKHYFSKLLLMVMFIPWVLQAQTTPAPASLPYTCGFEDAAENANWVIQNGVATNKFFIGQATANQGEKSLYISNDNGTTNAYTITAAGYAIAYREISIQTQGVYEVSFDWRANGESTYDFLRVFLVPDGAADVLTPSTSTTAHTGITASASPASWIAVDRGTKLNLVITWQNFKNDEIVLNQGNYKLVFYWRNDASGGNVPPIAIDNISISEVQCPKVSGLQVTNLTTNSAAIAWNTTPTNTFKYWYDTLNAPLRYNAQATAISQNNITLNNLQPNTAYTLHVQNVCGSDTTEWKTINFRTKCVAIANTQLPYSESFETWASGAFDPCYVATNSSTATYPSINTSNYSDGVKSLYMYSTATYATWLAMPAFEAPINTLQISFDLKKTAVTEYPFMVGVMTDPNDISTFTAITTVSCNIKDVFLHFNVPLVNYQGSGEYIALVSPNGVASYNYLDNVVVSVLPSCPDPLDATAYASSPTSAVLNWTSTGATGYEIEYGAAGFTLGSGTTISANGSSATISGLVQNTEYNFYLRSKCSATDAGLWIGPLSVHTPCLAIPTTDMPYIETFDSYTTDIATSTTAPTGFPNTTLPQCWSFVNMAQTSSTYPQAFFTSSTTYATSGNCLFFKSSNTEYLYAVLPQFEMALNMLEISFIYKNETAAATNGILTLGVMTNNSDASTFVELESYPINVNKTSVYHQFWADSLPQGNYYVAFRYGGGNSNMFLSIDSLVVKQLPSCPNPMHVELVSTTDQTANIAWDGNVSEYMIKYGEYGFEFNSPLATQTVTGTSVVLSGLTPASNYDFYIRSNCGNDTGNWIGPLTFRTECPASFDISTQSYIENFDAYTAVTSNYTYSESNQLPICWDFYSNGSNGPTNDYWPRIYKGTSYCPTSNNNALILNVTHYSTTPSSYDATRGSMKVAVLPNFSEPLYNTTIAFDARFGSASSSYDDSLFIAVVTTDSTIIPLAYYANPTATADAIMHIDVDLNAYQSTLQTINNGRLAIVYKAGSYSSSSTRYLGIDNIVVAKRSDCIKPYDAIITDYTTESATFVLRDSLYSYSYEVAWSTTNDVAVAELENNIESYSDTTGIIYNLESQTRYYAWVRTNCGSNYSQWVEMGSFRTLCETIYELPYVENFDSYTTDISTSTSAPSTYPNHTLPSCWNFLEMGVSGNPQIFLSNSSTYAENGNCLFFRSSTTPVYAVMPKIDADINMLQLSFTHRHENLTNGTLILGVMTTLNPDSFIALDTIENSQAKTRVTHQFWTDQLPENEYFIAFRWIHSATTVYYIGIDSVVVDYLPACPDPMYATAIANDEQSAIVSWTGNTGSYIVEYGTTGFVRGTEDGTVEYVYDTTIYLMGLNPNTLYDVYLRSDCGTDTGNWIGPIKFRTSCPEFIDISENPYIENFNGYNAVTSPTTYTASNELPACWNFYTNGTNGSTGTYFPRIYKGTYGPVSTDNALSMTIYQYTGTTASTLGYVQQYGTMKMGILPAVSEPLNNVTISFDAKINTVSATVVDTMFVAIATSDSTYIPLAHYQGVSGVQEIEINLANYSSIIDTLTIENPRLAIVFKASSASSTSSRTNYLGIDNVQIAKNSSCPHPSNAVITSVTSNSASFSFTDTTNVGNYEVAWTTVNDVTLAENSEVYSDTIGTIYNLETNTTYYAWVRANCGSAYSNWEVLGTFKTTCTPIDTLPYYEDFNSYSGNMISTGAGVPTGYPNHTIPDCWTLNINDGTKIFLSTNSSYRVNGNCLFFTGTNAAPGYAVLPNFSIPIESMLLEFTYRYENVSYGKAIIGAMTNPYDESTFIPLDTLQPTTTLTRASHAFWGDTLTGTNYYIAIKWHNATSTTVYYFAIDNLSLTAPTCHYVADAVTSNITSTSVNLNWTNTGADSYVVAYSTTSTFDPETCTTTINTTADSITINNLTPYTKYYYTVKAVCGSEQASWSEVASFVTLQDCGNLDLVEPVIGDTTLTTNSNSYPFYTSTSYTRGISWQIYEQTELEMQGVYSGNINSIAYDYFSTTPLKGFFNIYVTEIDSTVFSSTYDTIATSNMTLVYSDSIVFEKGWNTIIFNNAYNYSGNQNLVVAIERVGAINYAGYFMYTAGTAATTGYKTIYGYTTSSETTSFTRTYNRSNVIFNICTATPSCVRPADVVISNVQATQVDVAWTHEGNNFTVAYGPRGFSLDSTTTYQTVQTNATNITLTGLTQATMYDVYVRANCSGEISDWSFVETFTTTCNPISSLPYIEDFDSYTSDVVTSTTQPSSYPNHTMPSCWNILNMDNTPGTNYPQAFLTSSTTYASSGNTLFFKSKKATSLFAILPKINIDIDTLQISFIYRNEGNTDYNGTLSLGVMTDISDTNSFIELETYAKTTTKTKVEYIFAYDTMLGHNYTIAFRYKGGTSNNYFLSIDSVVVDYIPSCITPGNVVASNATETTVDLTWESRSANSWIIEYGPRGFQLGSGTAVAANTMPYTLTGLTHSTNYDVYVRSVCSATDTSDAQLAPCKFRTDCGIIDSLPWIADLDGTWWYYTNNPTTLYPTCWDVIDLGYMSGTTHYSWRRNSTAANVRTGTSAIQFAGYSSTSSTYQHNDYLITPEMQLTGNERLVFWMRNATTTTGDSYAARVAIYAYTVDPADSVVTAADYVRLGSHIVMLGGETTYTEQIVPLTGLTGNVKLAFVVDTNSYSFYIDDVVVEEIPECQKPRFITADSISGNMVQLSWNSTSTDFIVDYKKSSDSVWTTITGIWDTTTTITNLSPSTTYQFRIKAVCTAEDTSIWSDIFVATTECGPVTIPFFEDFSSTTFPSNCWSRFTGIPFFETPTSTTSGWTRITNDYGLQGPHAKINIYSTTTKYGLVTPEIDLGSIQSAKLSFDIAITDNANGNAPESALGTDDKFIVLISTDGGTTWPETNAIIWGSDQNDDYSINSIPVNGQNVVIDLDQYVGDTIKVAFYALSNITNTSNDIHIDNVLITESCPTPMSLSVVAEAISASINWTSASTNFQVSYKEAAAADWGTEIDITNATTYTITGLSPETDYQYRVRAICEDGSYSSWKEGIFTTPELPCIAPTDITATDITYTSASIGWTGSGNEVSWEVKYTTGGVEETIVATTNPVVIENLFPGSTYEVWVRAFCGAETYSDWSEVYTFNTAACEVPSNVVASNITQTSATISWTSSAQKWEISYGMQGVNEENGTKVIVEGTPSYTIEGLDAETTYDVYVRAICEDGVYSTWAPKAQFTTNRIGINTAANDNVSVSIYPNPANTEATISVEGINGKVEFVVADMNGRMIVTETINCEGQLVKTIDVSNLAKGAYFVHIYNDNFNTTRKLIVK